MLSIRVEKVCEVVGGSLLCGDKDEIITDVSIDSRSTHEGTLFVPIVGERVDAHIYIKDIWASGCSATFTQNSDVITDGCGCIILVKDNLKAMQALAAYYRKSFTMPIVGITGSVGKTTTREMVAAALSGGLKVYKTPANHNSQIGVPLTIFNMDDKADIAVLEMGMSMPGEMSRIAEIIRPDVAVFTNIGIAHIEQLKTRDNILTEKMHISDFMNQDNCLILNHDDDLLSKYKSDKNIPIKYYGIDNTADNYATDIDTSDGCASFKAHIGGKTVMLGLGVYGEHQVSNAIAALTVADYFHVDLDAAASKLSEFQGFKHRQQIIKKDGMVIIDDTYNASPDSMKAALKVLSDYNSEGRHIAVLADMKELGTDTVNIHKEIGTFIEAEVKLDELVTLGELAGHISEGLSDKYKASIEIMSFDDIAKLEEYVANLVKPGDVILFKGSNSMNLSTCADHMIERI